MSDSLALRSALAMAGRGLPVFPLMPGLKTPILSSSCSARDRPLSGGIRIATLDANVIRNWFRINPEINYGVSTSNIVVIDFDVRDGKNGLDFLKSLRLPPTFVVRTPSQGCHYYYQGPGSGQKPIGSGIDIRSYNGYVVGPGSVVEGVTYTVIEDRMLAPLPAHVREMLSQPGDTRAPGEIDPDHLDKEANYDQAIAFASTYPPAISGQGGNNHTYKLASAVADFGLSEGVVLEILEMHFNTRCAPPWSAGELQRIVANAYSYRRNPVGVRSIAGDFGDIIEEDAPGTAAVAAPAPAEDPSPFRRIAPLEHGESSIPARRWVIRDFVEYETLSAIVAPGGSGKSLFSLALAIGVAIGDLRWLGFPEDATMKPRCVVLVNNEDRESDLHRRIMAICRHHGLNYQAVQERLIIHAPATKLPYVCYRRTGRSLVRDEKAFGHLMTAIKRHEAALFIVDPFAEVQEADEKDNAEVIRVLKDFRAVTELNACAGLIVHHSRKTQGQSADGMAGNADTARGASGFVNLVRTMFTLYPMTSKEATDYGLPETERKRLMRLDLAKGNHTEGDGVRWFRRSSVELANGDKAPAISAAELSTQEDRDGMHQTAVVQTIGEMLDAGPVPLAEAIQILRQTPLYQGADRSELHSRLKRLFRTPVTIDERTVTVKKDKLVLLEDEQSNDGGE